MVIKESWKQGVSMSTTSRGWDVYGLANMAGVAK